MKKYIFFVVIFFVMVSLSYFELEVSSSDSSSIIGLTIDGLESTTFPTKESGKKIDSILCDKGATGVWDYTNWTLKVRNVTESRTKCQINFVSKYYEPILNGMDPVLKDGLIPVIIEKDGTVKKVSLGWEWYEYGDADNPRWANAVILNDETEIYYDGDIIPEGAIESYFVWIPRYQYKIFDMGNYEGLTSIQNKPQIIDIQFGLDTTGDSDTTCKTPMESGESGTCSVGKYMTHPAFLSFQSTGMWVGKFETGYKDATSVSLAQYNENNPSAVQIKPNVYSWRGINVANAYLSSYNYKRNLDSHMMKNTEWGAVAYLQHSQYGSHDSVRINNNENYITGYSAKKEPSCGYTGVNEECNKYEFTLLGEDGIYTINYLNPLSVYASTTNNYSGIYDMSGGSWEYVMGVMMNQVGIPCSGRDVTYNSGFNGPFCGGNGSVTDGISFLIDKKYYDTYQYDLTATKFNRRILGDATGEMGPFANKTYGTLSRQLGSWYEDEAWFISQGWPWFSRGRAFQSGTGAGIFDFFNTFGHAVPNHTFRIVLSV